MVARRDPAMARLIKTVGPVELRDPLADGFAALVRSIMYQQLAGAAATAIHARFLKLFADELSPAAVLALPEGAMRTAGVSGSKAAAIADLARKVSDGAVPLHDVDGLSDDELVARMVQVRGIVLAGGREDRPADLAAVPPPKALDGLVAHRRKAVRIKKLASVAGTVVVLERPHSCGEVDERVSQPGAAKVDQAAEPTVLDQHVGQAVVAVDEHVPGPA